MNEVELLKKQIRDMVEKSEIDHADMKAQQDTIDRLTAPPSEGEINSVAIALCIADGKQPYKDWRDLGDRFLTVHVEGDASNWTQYVSKAKAAIKTFMEGRR
jgi:hypothetical protein